MNKHVQFKKDGEHKGYIHKGLYTAIKDLEPIYGKEVYKSLGKILKHKHGEGKYHIDSIGELPDHDVDKEEIMEVLSSLINEMPEVKKKGPKKVKIIPSPEILVEPMVEEPKTGATKKPVTVGIQKWRMS
jgi:hypothetical protein